MQGLGQRLRERAREIGLADATVAERVGLSQQRYHNYTSDQTEPDFGTLVRICRALSTEPNVILGFHTPHLESSESARLQDRIAAAVETMALPTLRVAAALMDTLAREHNPAVVMPVRSRKPSKRP